MNIDGLASGALKIGLKNKTLGNILETFSDDQIKYIWAKLCGYEIEVIRQDNVPVAVFSKQLNQLTVIHKGIQFTEVPQLPEST